MIVLLSPAKTLDYDSTPKQQSLTDHIFPKETLQLVQLLRKKKLHEIKALMHISDTLAEVNVQRYKSFQKEYDDEVSRAAIEAFRGDVYLGLDYPTLANSDIVFAQQHLRILSGLYGILRPLDRMQPYRLEMGTRLDNKQGSNLYHFWGQKISKALNTELAAMQSDLIINLASNEYFKAIDQKILKANVIEANFKEEREGKLVFVSYNAKKARGMMARYIVQNKLTTAAELKGFDQEGYHYSEEHSDDKTMLFIK